MSHSPGWNLSSVSSKNSFKAFIGASAKILNSRIHRLLIKFGELFLRNLFPT